MTAQVLAADVMWKRVADCNPAAMALFRRHYSYNRRRDQLSLFWTKQRNQHHFVGPGQKMVLLTPDEDALFVWRKFISADGQQGVNCAVFRNESAAVASDLIREADFIAWERWPGERLYTYVDPKQVKRSRQPGRCFIKAGWRYVLGADSKPIRTKARNLLILEHLPPAVMELVR